VAGKEREGGILRERRSSLWPSEGRRRVGGGKHFPAPTTRWKKKRRRDGKDAGKPALRASAGSTAGGRGKKGERSAAGAFYLLAKEKKEKSFSIQRDDRHDLAFRREKKKKGGQPLILPRQEKGGEKAGGTSVTPVGSVLPGRRRRMERLHLSTPCPTR